MTEDALWLSVLKFCAVEDVANVLYRYCSHAVWVYNSVRVCERPCVADPAWLFEGGCSQGFIGRHSNSNANKDEVVKAEWQRGLCSAGVLSRLWQQLEKVCVAEEEGGGMKPPAQGLCCAKMFRANSATCIWGWSSNLWSARTKVCIRDETESSRSLTQRYWVFFIYQR